MHQLVLLYNYINVPLALRILFPLNSPQVIDLRIICKYFPFCHAIQYIFKIIINIVPEIFRGVE